MIVRQLPPSESFSSRVSLLSRYGMCIFPPLVYFSKRAVMQFPKARRDLLMLAPSMTLRFLFFMEAEARSQPAKSIRLSLATITCPWSRFDYYIIIYINE